MPETDLSKEVQAKEGEHHYPDCKVNLPVQKVPVVSLVCHGQEFKAEGYFYEAKHHLHAVEPAAALGELAQNRREQGQKGERQGKGNAEGQHCDHGGPELSLSALDKHGSNDGAGATETHQHQRKGKEEYAQEAALAALFIGLGGPAGGEGNLKRAKKGRRKHHEDNEEYDVGQPVRCQPVEDVRRHGFSAKGPCEADNNADWNRVQKHYEKAVHGCVEAPFCGRSAPFQEEGHGHGNHREHARGEEHQEAPEDGLKDEAPEALGSAIGRCRSALSFHLDGGLIIGRREAVALVAGLPLYIDFCLLGAVLEHFYALDNGDGVLAGADFHPKGLVLLTHHL